MRQRSRAPTVRDADDRRIKSLVITEEGVRLQEAFRQRLLDLEGRKGCVSSVAGSARLRGTSIWFGEEGQDLPIVP